MTSTATQRREDILADYHANVRPYYAEAQEAPNVGVFNYESFAASKGFVGKSCWLMWCALRVILVIINMLLAMLILVIFYTPFSIFMGLRYWYRRRRHPEIIAQEEEEMAHRRRAARFLRTKKKPKLMTQAQVDELFPIQTYKEAKLNAPSVTSSLHSESKNDVRVVDGDEEEDSANAVTSAGGATSANHTSSSHHDQQHDHHTGQDAFELSSFTEAQPVATDASQENKGEPALFKRITDTAAVHLGFPNLKQVEERLSVNEYGEEDDDEEDDELEDFARPAPDGSTDNSCAICIEEMVEIDEVRLLTCGHIFHSTCIDPWLTTRRAYCPLCKRDYYIPPPPEELNPDGTSDPVQSPPPAAVRPTTNESSSRTRARLLSNLFGGGQSSRVAREPAPPIRPAASI